MEREETWKGKNTEKGHILTEDIHKRAHTRGGTYTKKILNEEGAFMKSGHAQRGERGHAEK